MSGVELVKPSQHGLGHLLNPLDPEDPSRDWIPEGWTWVVNPAGTEPDWFARPAVGRLTVTSPAIHKLLEPLNTGRPYRDQTKPFNFLLTAFVHPLERPANDQRLALIAPYTNDPATWSRQPWINRYSARAYRITTEPSHGAERDGLITARTYGDILREYANRPEHKSSVRDGRPCRRATAGLLSRRHIADRSIAHIGKESNQLEAAQVGLIQNQAAVLNAYDDTDRLIFEVEVLPRLQELGTREVARRTGHSLGAVHAVLTGRSRPRPAARLGYQAAVDAPKTSDREGRVVDGAVSRMRR